MADNSYKLEFTLSNGRIINAGTIVAPQGESGKNGVTFIPSVSEAGILSWTNDGGLTNPDPVNIKGDAAVITESDVAGWGFTKNVGTITEIKMNGSSKGTSGVVDLGTVLTEHQSLENYVTLDGTQNITGKKTVISPANKDNSNQIATTAWAGRRYKSIADFGFTSQTTVKAIVQKIIDNWYEYCTFACTNDNFNNFSDTPDGYGTLIIEVGSNALRPLISFTKQIGDSNSYKHWQANIVRGANNQVSEIQWYELALKTDIQTNYVTTNTDQDIKGKKTVITPPDADNSTKIANTAWVLRNYNNSDICYRGVDSDKKYTGYYKVAEATLPNWCRVSVARIFVQDFDSVGNGVLNVSAYAGSTKINNVATSLTTAQLGFLEGTNCKDFKGKFFLVVRKQSTTERKPIKVELWYRQTGTYQRISATFLTDIGDSCGGLTASNKWVKLTRTVAQEQSYFDKDVVDLINGFVPNGKFTTTDIALDGYPVTEIYNDSTNNAQFLSGVLRIENGNIICDSKITSYSAVESKDEVPNFNGILKDDFYTKAPTTTRGAQYLARDRNGAYIGGLRIYHDTNGTIQSQLLCRSQNTDVQNYVYFQAQPDATSNAEKGKFAFIPRTNGNIDLGLSNNKWNKGYITNIQGCNVINSDGDNLTINGTTTFSNDIVCSKNYPIIDLRHSLLTHGAYPTETRSNELRLLDKDGYYEGGIRFDTYTDGTQELKIMSRSFGTSYISGVTLRAKDKASSANEGGAWILHPSTDGSMDLGASSKRWRNGYITNLQLCKVINGGGGNSLIQQNSDTNGADITVGSTGCPLKIQGKNARPVYRQGKNGTYDNLALQSDIPTTLSELTDGTKAIVNNTDSSNSWAFSGGGNTAGAGSTANNCIAIGPLSQTRYQKSIRIGTAMGMTPTNQSVTQIGVNNYTSSGRALYLGAGYAGFTYMNAAGSSWASASDIRDKTDIEEINHALDFIKKLKPITYVMNDRERYLIKDENDNPILDENGKQQYDVEAHKRGDKKKHRRFAGLSAQDTYQAMLDCYNNDTNYAQIVDNNKFDHPDDEYLEQYSMSYERLVPFLIKAVQEQQEQIDALKIKIAL